MSSNKAEVIVRGSDLSSLPTRRKSSHQNLVRGDLHGNGLNLLHFLVGHSLVSCSDELYQRFYSVYKSERDKHFKSYSRTELAKDKAEIDDIVRNITKGDAQNFVRLLGDELCDRGANDYFTLSLLERMDELGIPFEIYQSNHTLDFCLSYEELTHEPKVRAAQNAYRKSKAKLKQAKENGQMSDELKDAYQAAKKRFDNLLPSKKLKLTAGTLTETEHHRSLLGLNRYLENNLLSASELDDLVSVHQRHQKILGYSLEERKITLYGHAPIDLALIKSLAKKFEITYQDSTPEALALTIEWINSKYAESVNRGKLQDIIERGVISDAYYQIEINKQDNPLEYLFYNRNFSDLKRVSKHQGYEVCYVHGHTKGDTTTHEVCLNPSLGGSIDGSLDKQNNPIYHDDGHTLTLSPEVKETLLNDTRKNLDLVVNELQKILSDYHAHLKKRTDPGTEKKQQIIEALQGILENKSSNSQPVEQRIQSFVHEFKEQLPTLKENNRPWQAFFRNIVKALPLGLGYVFRPFLGSHGAYAGKQVNQLINDKISHQLSFFKKVEETPLSAQTSQNPKDSQKP